MAALVTILSPALPRHLGKCSAASPDLQQPACHASSPLIQAWGTLCIALCHTQVPASSSCTWEKEQICTCTHQVLFTAQCWWTWNSYRNHFFSFNIAFPTYLIYNGNTVQRGIYSLNYCQSKVNHTVNSTVTQMTNNFKGKENQDFAAYSVLFQETDKELHILLLSVLHLLWALT